MIAARLAAPNWLEDCDGVLLRDTELKFEEEDDRIAQRRIGRPLINSLVDKTERGRVGLEDAPETPVRDPGPHACPPASLLDERVGEDATDADGAADHLD